MGRRTQSMWIRYGAAVLSVIGAVIARWLLSRYVTTAYPGAPLFFAMLFSAWYGGFGPALTTSFLGLAATIAMADGRPGSGQPLVGLVLYAATSLGIASIGGVIARARQRIAHQIEELQRQHAELRAADRRKDEFLAVLAHELRNPLAPIWSSLQILDLPAVDPQTTAQARAVAERQLGQLTRLVDDLLDVSRIMRGKIELRLERVELATVAARALETARPLIDTGRHQLSVELPEAPVYLEADLVRLSQALGNLLCNAAKYTEAGGQIRLSAAVEGGQLVVRVHDSGIGIEPETLPRLFTMFMQVAPGAPRSQGGLGIGLTLVKNLVELHGGSVAAASAGLGRGSEFSIRLPLAADQAPPGTERPITDMQAADARRVLVVDDNEDAARSLALLLKLRGHAVQVSLSGPAALAAVRNEPPELVFLDIGMPGMDGYEVARRLRAEFNSSIELIALTGWGTEQDRQRSREAGFDRHLTKPVDLAALERVLAVPGPAAAAEEMSNVELQMANE